MKSSRSVATAALGGALLVSAPLGLVQAQAQSGRPPTVISVLTFSSKLEANDNYDLSPSSPGTATILTNSLEYRQSLATGVDTFEGSASGDLRFADLPVVGEDTALDNGTVDLIYQRKIDDSTAGATFSYNDVDIEFYDPLRRVATDGTFDDTQGSGRVSYLSGTADLRLGSTAPLSFGLSASAKRRDYRDTTDASLRDMDQTSITGEIGALVSPGYRLILDSTYATIDEENDYRSTEKLSGNIGLVADLRPTTRVDTRVGVAEADTKRASGLDRHNSGGIFRFIVTETLPDGTANFNAASTISDTGRQNSISVGRTLNFPSDTLQAQLGVSQIDGGTWHPTADLRWSVTRPTSTLSLTARQAMTEDSDGYEVMNSALSVSLQNAINPVSSWGVSALAGRVTQLSSDAPTNDITRVTVSAQYSHSVTQDWQMSTGLTHRIRNEDNAENASSNAVFVSLTRRFSAR